MLVDDRSIEQDAVDFYDELSADYDAMTGFDKRFAAERPFFRLIVERHNIKSAIDAGAGTGFHSFVLAELGVDVTAADVSSKMLHILQEHARSLHLSVKTVASDFQSLSRTLDQKFDSIFCLGNSLAHVLTDNDLSDSLLSFASLLKADGTLFIQLVNYERTLAAQQRVQSIRELGTSTFIRFYDFCENDLLRFNILKLDKKNGVFEQSLNSVMHRPYRIEQLTRELRNTGFQDLTFYGGISLDEYQPEVSKDLVIRARKGGKATKFTNDDTVQRTMNR